MSIVKISRHGNSDSIVIPVAYLKELGWRTNDNVWLRVVGRRLEVRQVTLPSTDQIEQLDAEEAHAEAETQA